MKYETRIYIAIIKAVYKFLKQGEEPDTAMIAKQTSFTSQQVYDFITGNGGTTTSYCI